MRLFLLNLSIATVLIAGFFMASSMAQGPGPRTYVEYEPTIGGVAFTTQALNAPKTTDAIKIGGWDNVMVEVVYVWTSGTHVTMTCEESPDNSTWFEIPEIEDYGLGLIEHYQRTWRWVTGGASANFLFEVPMRFTYLRCTFSSIAGAAGDTATVTMSARE